MTGLRISTALAAAAFSATPILANAQGIAQGIIDDRYYGHMYGGGMGFFGAGFMVLFWGGIILLAVFAVRWMSERNTNSGGGSTDAMSILRERLARGEIDPEEFEARRKALGE